MNIKFDNVSFSYTKNKKALDNINLHFNKSEMVFIMGHTGSGKSTLIQHINGLLKSSEGFVNVELKTDCFSLSKNSKVKNINELRKEIGIVFQFPEYQLFDTSVLKDVMFGPLNFFKSEVKAKELAKQALEKVGISSDYYDKSPFDLSGGEKRKVAIAGVLASYPSVIIMDEPTSSLDPAATKEMMDLIVSLKNEGKIIIIISHDTDLCYEYADRVIMMKDGKVVKDSDVEVAFNDISTLKEVSLTEPFVHKVKRLMNIKNKEARNLQSLKEVIVNE